jgi:hypothetical protein
MFDFAASVRGALVLDKGVLSWPPPPPPPPSPEALKAQVSDQGTHDQGRAALQVLQLWPWVVYGNVASRA